MATTIEESNPYSETKAAKMFRAGLDWFKDEKDMSQRDLQRLMDYRSSVAISHMQLGRILIPVDRAAEIARHLNLPTGEFLLAVLEQRHPETNWVKYMTEATGGKKAPIGKGLDAPSVEVMEDIEAVAGRKISELSRDNLEVMKAAAADSNPRRRWAEITEVSCLDMLRKKRPDIAQHGFSNSQRTMLADCIENL